MVGTVVGTVVGAVVDAGVWDMGLSCQGREPTGGAGAGQGTRTEPPVGGSGCRDGFDGPPQLGSHHAPVRAGRVIELMP
ncbi:hypothetical protein GCM10023258_28290 [Terrabacter aeriphilus]|uniref:Uncharacterized protein n=1 Tax=Terrabacter aeriphilus TaxID=515662 RepID=A0ABP9JJ49_9MICO